LGWQETKAPPRQYQNPPMNAILGQFHPPHTLTTCVPTIKLHVICQTSERSLSMAIICLKFACISCNAFLRHAPNKTFVISIKGKHHIQKKLRIVYSSCLQQLTILLFASWKCKLTCYRKRVYRVNNRSKRLHIACRTRPLTVYSCFIQENWVNQEVWYFFVVCHVMKLQYHASYSTLCIKDAQIPVINSHVQLKFVRWCLIFAGSQYGICFIFPFWHLEFWVGF